MNRSVADPHAGQAVVQAGAPLAAARAAMILVHGRGASAEFILTLAGELAFPDMTYLAPQAADYTWYPYSFLAPLAANEPGLSSGLGVLAALVAQMEAGGISAETIFLAGFSQGACLTLEFVARHARRYGAVLGFSGGLIGPDDASRAYPGSLNGTPVFLGCSDRDPHIPLARVQHTTDVLTRLGAQVTQRIYPNFGHAINRDELDHARRLITQALA